MQSSCRLASALAAVVVLAACSTLPPLTRSVVVQRNTTPASQRGTSAPTTAPPSSTPAHASGTVSNGVYHVMRGDTLYSIAFRAGVDFRQLAAWNGIAEPYVIHPGQALRLRAPGGGAVATNAPPATQPAASSSAPVFETVPSTTSTTEQPPQAPVFVTQPPAPQPPVSPVPAPARSPSKPVADEAASLSTVVPVAGKPVTATPSPAVVNITPGKTRLAGGIEWRWPADGALLSSFKSGDAIPGIDIAGRSGDPVRAAADGVVVYSGNGLVGYGELVIIKHSDSYLSAYGHNRKRLVKEGERVRAGQTIAEMGSSGASRDELQFQVRHNGTPVDPLDYLPSR